MTVAGKLSCSQLYFWGHYFRAKECLIDISIVCYTHAHGWWSHIGKELQQQIWELFGPLKMASRNTDVNDIGQITDSCAKKVMILCLKPKQAFLMANRSKYYLTKDRETRRKWDEWSLLTWKSYQHSLDYGMSNWTIIDERTWYALQTVLFWSFWTVPKGNRNSFAQNKIVKSALFTCRSMHASYAGCDHVYWISHTLLPLVKTFSVYIMLYILETLNVS